MRKTLKVIVSGDGGVGKTSFLNRLIHDNFNVNNELTKGIDFFSKNILINGQEYNFVMWDFAGQTQFRQILNYFYGGSIAAFVLFDLSRFNTLSGVEEWIKKLNENGKIPIFILGNKSDAIDINHCKDIDANILDIRRRYKNIIGYLRISSKTGDNVKQAFLSLLEGIKN